MTDTLLSATTHITPSRTTKLFADNGTTDGNVTVADVLGALQSGDIPSGVVPAVGTTAGTVAAGNDSRIIGALQSADAASAYATKIALQAAIDGVIAGAPGALNTLNEIAIQLASDESAAAALTTAVTGKLAKTANLSDLSDIVAARTNLGLSAVAASGSYADLANKPAVIAFDDPANASGLGAPAILRGTVNGESISGVIVGNGQTLAVRQNNLTRLQAGINYASANNKYFELAPGVYEISGAAGLIIPAVDGFSWQGTKNSTIKQCLDNAPVLSVADVSTGTVNTQDIHINGVRLYYLNDQTGQTNSAALKIGLVRNSVFENINIFAPYSATGPLQKAYRGIYVVSTGTNFGFFSNSLRDIFVGGADQCLMDVALVGTGSVFQNIYLTQGTTGNVATMSGPALRFLGNADQYETVLDQVNVEWVSSNQIIFAQNMRATTFLSCHFEGNQITGFDPCLFNLSTSQISLVGCNILDQVCLSGVTGTASLFRCYGDNTISGNNLRISWSGSARLTAPVNLLTVNSFSPGDANQSVDLSGISFKDVSGNNLPNFQFSPNMPLSAFAPPYALSRYQNGTIIDHVEKAVIQLPGTANYTHYQTHADATIMVPAALAANRTITLSAAKIASGTGSTLLGRNGNTVRVRRMAGTASNSLLVLNGGVGAGTLTTNTTAATDYYYRFDGTNWSVFT